MRNLLVLFSVLSLTVSAAAQNSGQVDEPGTYRFTEKVLFNNVGERDLHAELVVRTKAFNQANHKITRSRPRDGQPDASPAADKIDGRVPLGTGDGLPRVEIVSMVVNFGGVMVTVPEVLYGDCFNPNFDTDSFGTKFSDNGESMLVFMGGGEARNLYQVIWIIRKDGMHSRFINNCPDCDYKSILSFLHKK